MSDTDLDARRHIAFLRHERGDCDESNCVYCGEIPEKFIEFPSLGKTYCRQEYGVYEYDTFPESSVLAGHQRRRFVGSYPTLEQAQRSHPDALPVDGSLYQDIDLSHLPDHGDY
jgi:hypothetical protein